jgi:hypothetical protein
MKLGGSALNLRRGDPPSFDSELRRGRGSSVVRLRSPRLLSGRAGFSTVPFEGALEGLSTRDWVSFIKFCKSFCTSGECTDMDVVSFEV